MFNFDPNRLYYKMLQYCTEHRNDADKIIICNEGGSRSSKTWDTFHLLYTYCSHNINKGKEIYIFRDTLVNCKDYTYKEFSNCFDLIGVKYQAINPQKPEVSLFGNKIYFRGLISDEKVEAAPSDVVFINEMLDIDDFSMIAGWLMRCRELFICDWNPKYTDHWAYNFEKRPNCLFTHSTYKDNKHLQQSVINEIESLNPANADNVAAGTADEYRYKVYMCGHRAAPAGIVFKDVIYVDRVPDDCDYLSYGLDFGTTNETAITENHLKIVDGRYDLYTKKLYYLPTATSQDLIDVIRRLGIDQHIWCDDNQPGWITDMRIAGIKALKTKKFPGSREYWVNTIKRCRVHIVRDPDYRKEQENFRYRVVDGVQLSETVKKYDHLWSATGYSVVGDFRQHMAFES